jgi:hypothetical protein
LFGGAPRAAEAQLVWKTSDWKLAEFQKLAKDRARIKQLFDVVQIGDGKFLSNVKNSLNSLRFAFGVPEHEINIVVRLYGPANLLNYDDYVWKKYGIGEWMNVTDPATRKPAAKTSFYNSKGGFTTVKVGWKRSLPPKNPDDRDSIYQDTSMQALQARALQFLSYHTALKNRCRASLGAISCRTGGRASQRDFPSRSIRLAFFLPNAVIPVYGYNKTYSRCSGELYPRAAGSVIDISVLVAGSRYLSPDVLSRIRGRPEPLATSR